ncbi:PqiC family protein [Candidatus Thiosymbion oneisti]|uniref:PqiC family protein n=1 Tax=Candidatus Thiosymbion oneisti TaxID=589554 RepID=UPI000A5F3BEE|nr:PqiC family protein [Candidatus Thiosymbion oneisti]
MKTRFAAGSAALLLASLALGGCVTEPSSFYTLSSTLPTAEESAAPIPEQNLAVGIGPVRFPAFLDRPQIVARTADNQLRVDEFHRWGGSLEDDFLRVLSENLGQLLGTSRILVEPAEVRFPVDFRVVADVLKFEGTPDGNAVFKVRWGVLDAYMQQALVIREDTYRSRAANSEPGAMVAALSETLSAFSRDIAEQLRGLPKTRATTTPSEPQQSGRKRSDPK